MENKPRADMPAAKTPDGGAGPAEDFQSGGSAAPGYMETRYGEVAERLAESYPSVDGARLRAAYEFMLAAHEGQRRKSGEPYSLHPLEVAGIVAEMSLDPDSVVAALLHDIIEDTEYTYADLRGRFGADVADLVEGVTKLTRVLYSSKEEQQMENLRKMFLAMARDMRVILIKIADRLHNMRTIQYHDEKRRREIALETMEIYAPLAHRLGMQRIKWELEDLALRSLDPIGYNEIVEGLGERESHHADFLSQIQTTLTKRIIDEAGIAARVDGRVKHAYSIYRKMYTQHKALFEIYDLYAVRVIVESITDCYNVLGFVHDLYKPIPGRFKDYISTPKPNLYQSLHTTVIGREGMPFEVQIRTWEMHRTAEYGIAAHWMYKSGAADELKQGEKLAWVRSLLESQQDTDAEDFIRGIKVDMFADEVFVFTPGGDVINLPEGAGPVDFAYAIHSAVGNRMMGAKVNGRMVKLEYALQNGDIVEIITGNTHGPSRDWLGMVKTSEARNKIKQWFKKERREENIAEGKKSFEQELRRTGIAQATVMQEEVLPSVLKKMSFATLDDLYAAIGYGGLTSTRAVNRFRDELVRINKLTAEKLEKQLTSAKKPKKSASGVMVEGIENCLVKFSRCCTPVPGDKITGFITRGYGVSVHRADCKNVSQMRSGGEEGRWVRVRWAGEIKGTFPTDLIVLGHNRADLLLDLMTALSASHIPVSSVNARKTDDGYATVELTVEVTGSEQMDILKNKIAKVPGVMSVSRV